MQQNTDRILTTHVGSLPRPDDLLAMMREKSAGKPVDDAKYDRCLQSAVTDIVRRQVDCGIDVVDDGEFGKPNFKDYINQWLDGFEPDGEPPKGDPFAGSRDTLAFPEYYDLAARQAPPIIRNRKLVCTGPIKYCGEARIRRDINNVKAALAATTASAVFMPAVGPSNIALSNRNEYYKSREEYAFAIADALAEEYKAIVDAGFLVQIDDPQLATYYMRNPHASIEDCRRWASTYVDAINHALRGIPREKVRFHTCYGINMGPRVHDMELRHMLDLILRIKAGGYLFEAANPRHEHEWHLWETHKLPDGAVLIPGVVTPSNVVVEHPELVADRLMRYTNLLGRENVVAGTDCGFASYAGGDELHPTIAWAKLNALSAGAELASRRLWGRPTAFTQRHSADGR